MTQLENITSELNRLFDVFNKHYYNNEIQKPVIAVQTNGKDSSTMGWCTCNKVWKDSTKNEFYYEITICSEYLFRNVQEICSTLLHEMVHLYWGNTSSSVTRGKVEIKKGSTAFLINKQYKNMKQF
ncbi:SprT-like domain-containing protein [Clostridium arbusti]|uniref:SprT-like domain-containing protein n=1 Tax=Clostridium arbusti TaxID=1137848 RepID=UPI000289E565|nr:SprT-like domain-containing protein [Clostridium arbusti]